MFSSSFLKRSGPSFLPFPPSFPGVLERISSPSITRTKLSSFPRLLPSPLAALFARLCSLLPIHLLGLALEAGSAESFLSGTESSWRPFLSRRCVIRVSQQRPMAEVASCWADDYQDFHFQTSGTEQLLSDEERRTSSCWFLL